MNVTVSKRVFAAMSGSEPWDRNLLAALNLVGVAVFVLVIAHHYLFARSQHESEAGASSAKKEKTA